MNSFNFSRNRVYTENFVDLGINKLGHLVFHVTSLEQQAKTQVSQSPGA